MVDNQSLTIQTTENQKSKNIPSSIDDVDGGSTDGDIEIFSIVAKASKSKKSKLANSKKSKLTKSKKRDSNFAKTNSSGTYFHTFKVKEAIVHL